MPFLWYPPPGGGSLEPVHIAEAHCDLDTRKPPTFPLGSLVPAAPRTCWVLTWSLAQAGLSHTSMFPAQGLALHNQSSCVCGSPAGPTGHPLPHSLSLSLLAGGVLLIPSEPQAPGAAGLWEQNLSPPGLSLCWCRHLGLLYWDWLAAGASLGPCGQRPGWDFTVPPSGCWGQSYSPRPSAQTQALSVTLCEVALWGVLPPWCAWPKPQPPGFPLNLEPPGPCVVCSSALLVRTED